MASKKKRSVKVEQVEEVTTAVATEAVSEEATSVADLFKEGVYTAAEFKTVNDLLTALEVHRGLPFREMLGELTQQPYTAPDLLAKLQSNEHLREADIGISEVQVKIMFNNLVMYGVAQANADGTHSVISGINEDQVRAGVDYLQKHKAAQEALDVLRSYSEVKEKGK